MVKTLKTIRLFARIARTWAPQPDLTISQWADQYRVLTPEGSSEPGPWRTDRAPYQREIMDSINDPLIEEVAIMASAQVGKTEFLLNMIGYHIDQDPAPIMYLLPTEDLIKSFSQKRLAPMISASPVLRSKVYEAKGRDAGNTISEKSFPNGYITIVGANSPSGLSSRPIRIVLCDEVDRYPASAGTEGDPITLATERTATFNKRKHVYVSTPVLKETSRINQLYEDSTMEEWNLPCPHCDEYQPMVFGNVKFEKLESESGEITVTRVEYCCSHCGALGSEKEWKNGEGKWVPRKKHSYRRGFHLNQLVSPWVSWNKIVRKFLVAKREGPEKLKVWENTVMGNPWEEKGEQIEEDVLLSRLQGYPAGGVPDGVKVLTAAVDTQDDRFEIEVMGWGAGRESWGIEYHRIYGDLSQPKIWADLDEYLSRTWTNSEGRRFSIRTAFIDSGGHYTTEVYKFTSVRKARGIFAIKGYSGANGENVSLLHTWSVNKKHKAMLITLGVDEGKAKVFSSLQIKEPGPGYCHFPLDKGYNRDYFRGLTAEVLVTKMRAGVKFRQWKQIRKRNEPLDLRVYNLAALEALNPNLEAPLPPMDGAGGPSGLHKRPRRRGAASSV